MSSHKSIDKICVIVTALTLAAAIVFCCGAYIGIEQTPHTIGYEDRLFDRSKVHTIDIVMNDWDSFTEGCESEEYSPCSLVIDGEAVKNVGIRAKGNTSLSSVKKSGSSRYSFKIEFDQYDSTKSYHGLDKLCLNNLIQDNTYMKDYLAYTLMYDFGADAPLCSYAYITVNGEDWGLYLAVEAVEDSFLERNYGSDYGDLYKPDSMSFGGGRGNGKEFSMSDFMNENSEDDSSDSTDSDPGSKRSFGGGNMPGFGGGMPEGMELPEGMETPPDFGSFEMNESGDMPETSDMPGRGGFGGMGGMGTDDVKLKYIDDNASSYSNIFGSAKTTVNTADENRLIRSLKALSEQSDIEAALDTDEVLRYFVVHIFLCNGDSYTGQMIHNYYLYEEDGKLSMIPWDYNLAFGSFSGGAASSSVNSPIDTPVSGDMSDRPMVAWIFGSDEYTERYHELFEEFVSSSDISARISETTALIDEYVRKDPTKFCTYEEYLKGAAAISEFCTLRTESIKGQLDGTIPSTTDGQSADGSKLIDASSLSISDMGTMGSGGGFGGPSDSASEKRSFERSGTGSSEKTDTKTDSELPSKPDTGAGSSSVKAVSLTGSSSGGVAQASFTQLRSDGTTDFSGQAAGGFGGGMPPGGFGGNMPEGFDGNPPEGFDGNMPEGFDGNPPEGFDGNMPEGFDGNMPGNIGESDENSSDSAADSSDSSAGERTRAERPSRGDFPGMGGMTENSNTERFILLGVSVLVLAFGLVFAKKFKR